MLCCAIDQDKLRRDIMEWETLRFERADQDDQVGVLILDRPPALNAVNEQLIADFKDACQIIQADASLRVLVLKGEGRGFCSGMDLQAAANRPAENEALAAVWAPWAEALDMLEDLDQLTIAAVHGPCLGAGFELILACDFRIATRSAFFALPQVRYGTPPDVGQNYRLPQLIGLAKAKEILILGQRFDAVQAERWGLLTRVVEPADFERETQQLIVRCLQVGSRAATEAKHLLAKAASLDRAELTAAIDRARAAALETGEFAQSLQVYREQRKPQV